ncbi:MAG TPA: AAA family ATPase, partial [Polyangia bacterium]
PLSPLGTARQRLAPVAAYPPGLLADLHDADLGEEEAYLAWQMGQLAGEMDEGARKDFVRLIGRSLINGSQGSTRMPLHDADRAILAAVPSLVGVPGEAKPLIVDGGFLYSQRIWVCETRLAAAIRKTMAQPALDSKAIATVVAEIAATSRPKLGDEQRAAVEAALGRRLAVVSGGPGTGKTTIALAIARGLVRLGVPADRLALTAPTGKAANRLQESFRAGLAALHTPSFEDRALHSACPAAQTLHRLLGYSPSTGRFHHHQNHRLSARAVIADEGSMIDLVLMQGLLRALPDDAVLVLLGDPDQLPSVEAGAVFRDLGSLAVRLETSFRTDQSQSAGRSINQCASAVRAGDAARLNDLVVARPNSAALTFEGVELLPASEREAVLADWYHGRIAAATDWDALIRHEYRLGEEGFSPDDEIRLQRLHTHLQRQRVLCLTRERPTGANPVNDFLHRLRSGVASELMPGEPVMVLRNDYERGLWNGDQGFIVTVRERSTRRMAVFRLAVGEKPHWLVVDPDALGDSLALAYALTIHKAQGSEYDQVLLLLPDTPLPLLTRELLYTALTRSRHSVVICGSRDILAAGVTTSLARSSGLAERLSGRAGYPTAGSTPPGRP